MSAAEPTIAHIGRKLFDSCRVPDVPGMYGGTATALGLAPGAWPEFIRVLGTDLTFARKKLPRKAPTEVVYWAGSLAFHIHNS